MVTFLLCCPTAAGWKALKNALSSSISSSVPLLRRFVWITKHKQFSSNHISLVVKHIVVKEMWLFITVVLRRENLGRIYSSVTDQSRFPDRDTERVCFSDLQHRHGRECLYVCVSSTSRSARSACSWETFSLNSFSSFLLDSTSSPFSLSSLSRCSFSRSMIRSLVSGRRRRRRRRRRGMRDGS